MQVRQGMAGIYDMRRGVSMFCLLCMGNTDGYCPYGVICFPLCGYMNNPCECVYAACCFSMWEMFRRVCVCGSMCGVCVYGVVWYAGYVNRKLSDYGLRLHIIRLYVLWYMCNVLHISA